MFDSIVAYQNYPPIESLESRLQGLKISDLRVSDQTSFPLLLQATGNGNALSLRFSYDANRFADDAIERMIGHLRTLMESLPACSKKRVGDLPMLTSVEIESFLMRWNGPQASVPQFRCLHQRFEEHAERTPDAIAVTCEGQQLTYSELNRQANQIAHDLTAKGVGPEVVVGICTDRSIPMIVGVLAILKAGGVYLPLDPDYPQARLEFMLEDSGASLLLTQQELLPRFSQHKPDVVCVDTDWNRITQEPLTNLECRTVVENTAYIIYTSGSTGRPKGTSITHANVGRLFDTTQPWFHFDVSDVWTMFHSLAFDFSVWEVWGALLFGGRLVIVPYFVSRSPESFYELLRDQHVTVLNQTPSAFRQIVQLEENVEAAPLALRYVIFGGEALDIQSVAPWFERHGDQQPQLVNMYGITETTVHVTYRPLTQTDAVAAFGRSVIGRPIPDLRIYLLDEQLQGVPVGIAGELHVGGSGLSRGYLGRPELTADRFIPDPFSSVPGARLYKSGDLACRLPDGDIEYLGRIDQQVKVRGFRIEPAEIEAILASHPAVRQAVVMLRGDAAAASLVGYVVPRDGETASLAEPASCEGERTALWQTVFDETYRQGASQEDPTFNITGWNSSYTGLPIASEEMRSWVNETVDQIRDLQPNRVLEIGCGTGLLLLRLAPQCAQYVATDFSQVSLDYVSHHASALGVSNLTLYRRMADDFERIEENFFDTVILNSVVQYFPSIDYLVRVLEGAVRCVKPGGNIFVGDLRNLRLLEAFHTSIEIEHAGASLGRRELQDQVRRRIAQEEELVIDPAFFAALKQHLHKIADVDVRLKRGRYINELTQFRYDVVLHVGDQSKREHAAASVEWRSLDNLREVLSREESVEVRRIPNGRVFAATKAVELLSQNDGPDTAGALRQALQSINNEAVDPAHLIALGEELGCSVSLTWSADSHSGSFDVLFHRSIRNGELMDHGPWTMVHGLSDFSSFANNPLRGILGQKLVPELRRHLRSHVPEYMVPASFVVLDWMPLTRNGKIDRAALPLPSGERPKLDVPYVPPSTEIEKELARIWVDVLGVDRIGIHDNFFDLGGHSLMVIQLMSRVRKAFQVELPLRDVFTTPTIKEIADMLEAKILAKASSEKIDQLLAQLESMDDKKALQMLGSGETKSE
jgi:amino acid adenylation domain-containing protein